MMNLYKKHGRRLFSAVLIVTLLFSISFTSFGQGPLPGQESDKNWNFVIEPYFWFGALNGQLGAGRVESDFDISTSDIFSNLNMAFMIYGEVRYKRFGIAVDWLTMNLGMEGTRPITGGRVRLDPKITFLETSFLYSLVHTEKWSADVRVGVRSWWMKSTLEADRILDLEPVRVEADKSWVDPIIGMNAVFLPHEKWPVTARFDIGGFGAGSEFSWNVQAGAGFRFARSWTVLLQYRALGVDYRKGESGSSGYFKFDAKIFGTLVGIMATF